jgi:hypothetical protein
MGQLSNLKTMARERATRAVRTARALTDMAVQFLDWERAHRALVAAEHGRVAPRDAATPPATVKRARGERPGDETLPLEVTATPDGAPPRFRDTIAASHAPRVPPLASTLGPDDTLVSLTAPALDPADHAARTRASH